MRIWTAATEAADKAGQNLQATGFTKEYEGGDGPEASLSEDLEEGGQEIIPAAGPSQVSAGRDPKVSQAGCADESRSRAGRSHGDLR